MRTFAIVVAADRKRGIGKAGTLPWRLPRDMAYFKRVTSEAAPGKRNAVIMGRKTFESIPVKFRPLAGRLNVVLTRAKARAEQTSADVCWHASLDQALAALDHQSDIDEVFVIGGGQLYSEALIHPACARVYLTRVHATLDCDTHLAGFEGQFRLVTQDGPHRDNGLDYTFEVYERSP